MANPLISVIIPVYNAEQFLPETLDSVFRQTYKNIEVIAIDDGSTDKSAEVITRYPTVRYIFQKNRGVNNAHNTGIKAASGDYIAFLDNDDIWLPEKLKIQVDIASRHKESGIIICDGVMFSDDCLISDHLLDQDIIRDLSDTHKTEVTKNYFYDRLLKNNPIGCNSQELIPLPVINEIGVFAEKGPDYSTTYDYYLRIAIKYPFTFHGDSLVRYRYHPSSQSGTLELRRHKHIFMKIKVLKEHRKKRLYPREYRRDIKKAYHHLVKIAAWEARRATLQKTGLERSYLGRLLRTAPTNGNAFICIVLSWLPNSIFTRLKKFLKFIGVYKYLDDYRRFI